MYFHFFNLIYLFNLLTARWINIHIGIVTTCLCQYSQKGKINRTNACMHSHFMYHIRNSYVKQNEFLYLQCSMVSIYYMSHKLIHKVICLNSTTLVLCNALCVYYLVITQSIIIIIYLFFLVCLTWYASMMNTSILYIIVDYIFSNI